MVDSDSPHHRDDPRDLVISGYTPRMILDWIRAGCPGGRALDRLVSLDPALLFQTLRICNSPFYGNEGRVTTPSHARALLGTDPLKGVILGAALRAARGPSRTIEVPADPRCLWAHALHVAVLARLLARDTGYDLPEEAYVAGLLHDAGKCLSGGSSARWSGSRHARRAGALARRCRLPRGLAAAIAHHHDSRRGLDRLSRKTRRLTALLAAADYLAHVARNRAAAPEPDAGGNGSLAPHAGGEILAELGLEEPARAGLLERAEREMAGILGSDASPPGGLALLVAGSARPQRVVLDADLFCGQGEPAESVLHFVNRAGREIRQMRGFDEVIEAVLDLLHRKLGFDRAIYLERGRGTRSLSPLRAAEGTNFSWSPGAVPLAPRPADSGVGRVLRRLEGVLVRDGARHGPLLDFFGVPEMALAPVVVKGHAVGILAIDQFARGLPLGGGELGVLEMLAAKLGMILENLELASQGRKLRKIAEKDPLTGINNRRYCIDLFRKEIERARRYAAPLSVVLVDLDHFKEFNDSYGHAAGDRVLRDLARLIESNSRKTDVIGRFGGDEFLVILPQITSDQAITYAERVRARVADLGRTLKKLYPRCSLAISIGVATWRKGDRIEQVIGAADTALYAAKERGRNRVCSTE